MVSRETETYSRARGGCHMSTFPGRGVTISASIIASFYKVGNMLANVSFAIELFKLWQLVACWHFQTINPLRIRLSVCVGRLNDTFHLVFYGFLDELLQLIGSDHFVGFLLQLYYSLGRIFFFFVQIWVQILLQNG